MSRIGDALKRAGTEEKDGFATLGMDGGDVFVEGSEPAASSPRTQTATQESREIAEVPAGVFEPYAKRADEKLVVHSAVSPLAREQYRRLAATLHHVQAERGLKSILVGSALAEEGKTLTAINIALTLSESYRRKVLLIDADLRRPTVHQAFGFENIVGLADALAAKEERRLPIVAVSPRLSVLPAGRPSADPMEALTSSRMLKILDEAANVFDWIIIDTPPVGLLTDANLLAAMLDGAVFVVAAGRTPCAVVQKAVEALGRDRILGVILNRVEESAAMAGDYYYRYYGATHRKRPFPFPFFRRS
jgi:capsular exopolysaccharide synthesis family protein